VTLSLIAAVARNGVIGKEGRLPWKLPADLAYFKRVTMGSPVIMGRRTFQAIGKPLEGRRNIVLSREASFQAKGCTAVHSIPEALEAAGSDTREIFVIGGAHIYALFFPLARRLYITHVDAEVPGDAVFPRIEEREWRAVRSEPGFVNDANPLPHRFVVYEKK
jgi:dihydrofolate reductase